MKQMKNRSWARLLCLMLALTMVMAFALCGCGKKNNEENKNENTDIKGIVLGDGDGKLEAQDFVDGYSKLYGSMLSALGTSNSTAMSGMENSMSVSFGDDLMTLLAGMISGSGMDLDISWLKEIGYTQKLNYDGSLMQTQTGITLNGKEILSADMIVNLAKGMIYMGFPELSSKYLNMDMGAMAGVAAPSTGSMQDMLGKVTKAAAKLPSEQELNAVMTKYLNVALQALPTATSENVTLSYSGVSQDVTATTYSIGYADLLNIAKQILTTAKSDAELEKVVDGFAAFAEEVSGETLDVYAEMVAAIPAALEEIEELLGSADAQSNKVGFRFTSYTAGEAQVGFKVTFYEYVSHMEYDDYLQQWVQISSEMYEYTFQYVNIASGNNTALQVDVRMDDKKLFELAGTGTNKDGKANGSYQLSVDEYSEILTLEVKDFDTNALKKGIFKGTLRLIPSEELMENAMGLSNFLANPVLELVMDVNATNGNMTMNILNGNKLFLSFKFTSKMVESGSVKVPSGTVDLTDSSALMNWVTGLDFDKVLKNLKKADVPTDLVDMLEMLLDQYLG